ncbi:helix-turn-helix domain-containing protein [Verminephrobacter eiseniae]|uniref:helix-turn-helix domain-containing protein n=1 Tax=Verminephrobacter eiseniae TaxID=364317 RepID=UPI002237C746|nr:helix-turn-helix domain-containing protein [Verminephrobacter eiseniae]MCW5229844.1 helix-turn-helix domain-containing protein [Verminephrobacter eiseniae]MCW5291575.1 helix-turn-helix domain-containing protein [Verminephrobacter eiseniae]MCW8186148.1 helix-turn-helix domain-containing protein [Verminephrobacter eiseniae]MCW8222906.1 helix-turn-helix domain-containing protein [Verminephrobacter eiseniae]MCW8235358.1 helix-turn-helix domain-containing protein [Verminephrobacter eiseniae]
MNLTEAEVVELRQQANGRSVRADLARRARLILRLAEGLTWSAIRAKLDGNDSYIALWSKRFAADRLAGLFSRHAGRQRYKVTDRLEARVLARTTKHKPADGSTHWSTRKLAAELGGDISHMTVPWLNQVELWFAKIERDVIARGVFTSVPDLKRKPMRYIRKYNEQAKSVQWKYFDPTRRITTYSIITVHQPCDS